MRRPGFGGFDRRRPRTASSDTGRGCLLSHPGSPSQSASDLSSHWAGFVATSAQRGVTYASQPAYRSDDHAAIRLTPGDRMGRPSPARLLYASFPSAGRGSDARFPGARQLACSRCESHLWLRAWRSPSSVGGTSSQQSAREERENLPRPPALPTGLLQRGWFMSNLCWFGIQRCDKHVLIVVRGLGYWLRVGAAGWIRLH